MFKNSGPGVLVAAAFIGPGTVTACTIAGVGFGYALLWAMLLSVGATIFLQEMAARVGLVTHKGLPEAIRVSLPYVWMRNGIIAIVLLAILLGNAAYEGGNIGGAVLGMEAVFGNKYMAWFPWIIGAVAFGILWIGSYSSLEKVFFGLIFLMSISFIATAVLTRPDLIAVLKGLFVPQLPEQGWLTVLALVGTTIVPYNLFLHASLVQEKWRGAGDLKKARIDTVLAVGLGGLVSMCIIIAAKAIPTQEVTGLMDLAMGLEPLMGKASKVFLGIGLFAAGITSSITAPLAAAYVANSSFNWNASQKDIRFRAVWMVVLFLGVGSLSLNFSPIEIIKFAQIANGILLPVMAILLVWITQNNRIMGLYKNSWGRNLIGLFIILLSLVLGIKSVLKVLGIA
ncbi:MAG: Nramp family divalent metal transporter [Bacteroidota bacterium]